MSNVTNLTRVFSSLSSSSSSSSSSSWSWKLAQLRTFLEACNYTNAAVQAVVGIRGNDDDHADHRHVKLYADAPIYLPTIPPNTLVQQRPVVATPVQCLLALFGLGWTLPYGLVQSILGQDFVSLLLHDLHLVQTTKGPETTITTTITTNDEGEEEEECLVFALISLIPLAVPSTTVNEEDGWPNSTTTRRPPQETIWVATDWHPNVLGTTRPFGNNNNDKSKNNFNGQGRPEPVYYIGPDSLALVQLAIPKLISTLPALSFSTTSSTTGNIYLMDIGTGSGIQAMVATHYCSLRLRHGHNHHLLRLL
ncbi:hypothetical protein ACA910_012678 [Epithemia clementina (nom. ined.)]